MGILTYAGRTYELEDRLLAHLKIAIAAKLRLGQGFLLSWPVPGDQSSGRVSLWLSPGTPLAFEFRGSKPPELNRVWLQALERSSQGLRGMTVMPEQDASEYLEAAGGATAP